jgi:hypothetical protein
MKLSPLVEKDALLRRIEGIERQLRELGPSIAKSFNTTVAQLVTYFADDGSASGFTVPTGTSAPVLTRTITVPDGYTTAAVIAMGTVVAVNGSGAVSFLYVGLDIGGYSGDLNVSASASPGEVAVTHDHQAQVLTGLTPGSTFTVAVRAKGDPAWGSTSTAAGISILVTFSK